MNPITTLRTEKLMTAHVPLPAFQVRWEAEVVAPNAFTAAGLALADIRDPACPRLRFTVTAQDESPVEIDLSADTGFTARSLRQGMTYTTRRGEPVEILSWDQEGEFPLFVRIALNDGQGAITGLRTKAGLHPQGVAEGKPHPLDIVEANPAVTKWLRLYDRKLNEAGKQVVNGKEFAAERGLFMYLFDTEAEARANLQGARAVFPITYREGEGLG